MTRTPDQIKAVRALCEMSIAKQDLPAPLAAYKAAQLEAELWKAVEREIRFSVN